MKKELYETLFNIILLILLLGIILAISDLYNRINALEQKINQVYNLYNSLNDRTDILYQAIKQTVSIQQELLNLLTNNH